MLSYRHAYHAGNFADVFKHLIVCRILAHLNSKDKPYCVIDTHAGAGIYSLTSEAAQKNREYAGGIARLWQCNDLPAPLADYLAQAKSASDSGKLNVYPGSPHFIRRALREQDRAVFFELHPTDFKALHAFAQDDTRLRCEQSDGLDGCLALLPPAERRGLILIDPSYELKNDTTRVPDALQAFYKRFATGIYAIWYPIITRAKAKAFVNAVASCASFKRAENFEINIRSADPQQGMTGCGMIMINAPWTLADELTQTLPVLARLLGNSGRNACRIESLAGA
jgi:23S rRNA (adenine2030-N6)-methyltransferase